MIHYNVWFSFKAGTDETARLAAVRSFLQGLQNEQQIASFQLLRNRASGESTRLARFQALNAFRDAEQFGLPFGAVAAGDGPHEGAHGSMIAGVDTFIVEVFDELQD